MVLDEGFEPAGVLAELEIPVLFFNNVDLAPLRPEVAAFIAIAVLEELFLPHRVGGGVGFFVELAVLLEITEDALHTGFVAGVRGLGPAVVMDAEFFPKVEKLLGGAFDKSGRVHPFAFCGLLDFLAVLVDSS